MNFSYGTGGMVSGSGDGASASSKRSLRRHMLVMLIGADSVAITASFLIAAILYNVVGMMQWLVMAGGIVPVYLVSAARSQAYSGQTMRNWRVGVARSVHAFTVSVGIITLVAFFLKIADEYSRVTFAVGAIASILSLAVSRAVLLQSMNRILQGDPYSAVLITDGTVRNIPGRYAAVVNGSLPSNPTDDCLSMYGRLGPMLHGADRVVIAVAPELRPGWVHALKGMNVRSEVLAPELGELAPLGVNVDVKMPTLIVALGPLAPFDEFVKRAFDLTVASVALILLSPIMLATVIAIKLDSPGPALFVQTRIGRGNRVFRMLKFRSMRSEQLDPSASRLVTRNDDRVTRVGRFIRRTSIDELPQFINVLMGHMSVVGPRPHALGAKAATKLYWEVDHRYWHRHTVKPGLTGLAQVRGFRGNTEREQDLTDRLQADLEYLHGWSIWRDLHILYRTFHILLSKNAY